MKTAMKALKFIGSSLDDLRNFPDEGTTALEVSI